MKSSSELTRSPSLLPVLGAALIPFVAYHIGARGEANVWIREAGALGFVIARVGTSLARDYYLARNQPQPSQTLFSAHISPPQLVLKASWGAYLFAFLFAVIVSMALGDRGWIVMVLGVGTFLFGYYSDAPPIIWNRRPGGFLVSGLAFTWIPYLTGRYVVGGSWRSGLAIWIVGLYLLECGWTLWQSRQRQSRPG